MIKQHHITGIYFNPLSIMHEISCSEAVNFLIVVYFIFEKISEGKTFARISAFKAKYVFVTFQKQNMHIPMDIYQLKKVSLIKGSR
jgi:hypothetical protein